MPIRVLIVEDEPVARRALHEFFSLHGLLVRSAGDAEQAIMIGRTFRPSVLLCDWWLGGNKDGVDVAKALSSSLDRLQIIFMTGHPRDHLVTLAGDLDVKAIYQKPVPLADLRTVVDNIARQRRRS